VPWTGDVPDGDKFIVVGGPGLVLEVPGFLLDGR
jgi:hypothetical protein